MINTLVSKNPSWNSGDIVKVGFIMLKVLSVESVKDGLPDIYHLVSLDGKRDYEFIPYRGLKRL